MKDEVAPCGLMYFIDATADADLQFVHDRSGYDAVECHFDDILLFSLKNESDGLDRKPSSMMPYFGQKLKGSPVIIWDWLEYIYPRWKSLHADTAL
ncbi:hypothetical protein HMSSN139_03800 [Paenibacillus sp. HMSSN-139]|nr:hypothetical protein HMSSN139_03800 [Paenibacillus sp. HMSSN-139]